TARWDRAASAAAVCSAPLRGGRPSTRIGIKKRRLVNDEQQTKHQGSEHMTSVNSGSRLDRLPIGPFHRRIMLLIAIGMFFDGFDIYLAGSVLGVVLKTGFSTLPQNATFISLTFVGMMLGSFGTGFLGDRFGRRFTYQFNLLVFGFASLTAALAPDMT